MYVVQDVVVRFACFNESKKGSKYNNVTREESDGILKPENQC